MAKGKKRPAELPEYGTVMMKGVQYYRTRITDADGKRVAIYGLTPLDTLLEKLLFHI